MRRHVHPHHEVTRRTTPIAGRTSTGQPAASTALRDRVTENAAHYNDVVAVATELLVVAGLFLFYFILTNLVLGLFNLLPIPPLDGGRILTSLLPDTAAMALRRG